MPATLLVLSLGCAAGGAGEQVRSLSVEAPSGESTAGPGSSGARSASPTPRLRASTTGPPSSVPSTAGSTPATGPSPTEPGPGSLADGATRPDWLGRRPLPTTPDGQVVPQTTPEELRNRRFPTIDTLPPPPDDRFRHTIGPIPDDVLLRSTWVEGCPVPAEELRYLTLTFWGFDGEAHTGEMIVNAGVADDIASVFRSLHEVRFPLEEMRVVSPADLAADPTGDGNNTTAFVCRPVTGGTAFSQHAYGLAVDVNPFQNPYARGDLVLPELSTDYLDRSTLGPGTITAGDAVVEAFAGIGWSWGGNWTSLKDYHHFSLENR